MILCCFYRLIMYCHPLHRWVALMRAGSSVKKRLPAESNRRIEGRSLGFHGLLQWASTGTRAGCTEWKSSNGKGIQSREWVWWVAGGRMEGVWRFVFFWTASTMREEVHRAVWTPSPWEVREQARGEGGVFLEICIKILVVVGVALGGILPKGLTCA